MRKKDLNIYCGMRAISLNFLTNKKKGLYAEKLKTMSDFDYILSYSLTDMPGFDSVMYRRNLN